MIDNLLEIELLTNKKIVSETCNRIGIANTRKKILYPSCYIYEVDDKIYLAHFKQMFLLTRESAYNAICEDDIYRRNAIAYCLKNWGLIDVDDDKIKPYDKYVFVLPYNEKKDWTISHKFNFRSLNIINN